MSREGWQQFALGFGLASAISAAAYFGLCKGKCSSQHHAAADAAGDRKQGPKRQQIAQLSAEVKDDNPYSRLMALKRMGVVQNYERIREVSVVVVGIGGIGSVAAEMLTRCGVGKLILYDYDKVELANMNRLFFTPDQAGMTKVEASRLTLNNINPDVTIEAYPYNITSVDYFPQFMDRVLHGGLDGGRVTLVLSCVDNYEARMAVNQCCNELDQVWMESGVSENAVSGHIQFLLPGRTACFECAPPLIVNSGISEKSLKREGVCAASLPTTMGCIAALLVQNVLKYTLDFGDVSYYLGYNAMKDFFPTWPMNPNPNCSSYHCKLRQAEHKGWKRPVRHQEESQSAPVHADNDWGIELGSDSSEDESGSSSAPVDNNVAAAGLSFAHEAPTSEISNSVVMVESDKDESLDDMLNQFKQVQSK